MCMGFNNYLTNRLFRISRTSVNVCSLFKTYILSSRKWWGWSAWLAISHSSCVTQWKPTLVVNIAMVTVHSSGHYVAQKKWHKKPPTDFCTPVRKVTFPDNLGRNLSSSGISVNAYNCFGAYFIHSVFSLYIFSSSSGPRFLKPKFSFDLNKLVQSQAPKAKCVCVYRNVQNIIPLNTTNTCGLLWTWSYSVSLKISSRLAKIIQRRLCSTGHKVCAHAEMLGKLLGIFQDLLSFENHVLGFSAQIN